MDSRLIIIVLVVLDGESNVGAKVDGPNPDDTSATRSSRGDTEPDFVLSLVLVGDDGAAAIGIVVASLLLLVVVVRG
jgi:hypothetical protein